MEFVLGGCAAVGAGILSNPMEVAKTRMQLQGELQAKGKYQMHYKNVIQAMWRIGSEEGLRSIQKGLVPALWYQFTMNGVRLGAYHWLQARGFLQGDGEKVGGMPGWRSVVAGAVSGCIGTTIGSPFYLIKTHLQADVGRKKNPGVIQLLTLEYREGGRGLVGLWKGVGGAIPRVAVGSATQLTTFAATMELLKEYPVPWASGPWAAPILCSMASGVTVSVFMTPLDVVATRLYQQPLDSKGKGMLYSGWFDSVWKIFRTEGPPGFYKGWTANLARVGPHTVFTLVFWHWLRTLFYNSGPSTTQPSAT